MSLLKPAVSRIHLLKTMTLELSEIQTLVLSVSRASEAVMQFNSRNVDGGVEGGLGRFGLNSIGVDGGQSRVGSFAGAVARASRLLVGHLCSG